MSPPETNQSFDLSRAIAYLKAEVVGETENVIELSGEDSPVLRDLGNGLLVTYVVDQGHSFEFVQQRHLQRAGLSEAALHALAIENLADFCRAKLQVHQHSQIFAFLCGGNFEASLLLVDGLWDIGMAEAIEPPYVAAIPARDILAVCSGNSLRGIQELRGLFARIAPHGDHLLTSSLYIREQGKWQIYEPTV